ncbi:unnamed protein product [Camellia sinensis]
MSDAQELLVIVNFLDFGSFINFKLKKSEWWESQSFWLSWWTLPSSASWGHTLPKDTLLWHIPLKVTHRLDTLLLMVTLQPDILPQVATHQLDIFPWWIPTINISFLKWISTNSGHGGPSMGTLIAGGAAAAYGAHHLSHGGHHSSHGSHQLSHGHHHGKFKHGKFGKHKKHEKHHGGKVPEVQEMEVILVCCFIVVPILKLE